MDLKKEVLKLNTYLRTVVPASKTEDLIRKMAFSFYMTKRYAPTKEKMTLRGVSNNIEIVKPFGGLADGIGCVGVKNDCVYKSEGEVLSALTIGWEDYWNAINGGYIPAPDTTIIDTFFNTLTCDELLQIVNMSFEDSVHDDSTPESVSELVLRLASLYAKGKERVTDMTCSKGSFLLKASKKYKIVEGVEFESDKVKIARMRLFASQISGEIRCENCFEDSWHHQASELLSDLVFSEFPWKLVVKNQKERVIMENCNANRFAVYQNTATDYYFLSAMMNYLKREGVGITVMPLASLSNIADREVRKHIVENGYLKEVIALPLDIFNKTSVQTALVVIGLKPEKKVSFFDASDYYIPNGRKSNSIDVDRLLIDLRQAKLQGTCLYDMEQIADADYSFSPLVYPKKIEKSFSAPTELEKVSSSIFTGWQVSSAKLEAIHKTGGTGTKLLQASNIESGNIIQKFERYDIPVNTIKRFMVMNGDVVISTKLSKVKAAVVEADYNEVMVAASSVIVIRPKKMELDPYYLVAYLESDLGQQVIRFYQSGNVILNLSIGNVKKLLVPRLSYKAQKRIGERYKELRDIIKQEKERINSQENEVRKMFDKF